MRAPRRLRGAIRCTLIFAAALACPSAASADPIRNAATGSANGVPLALDAAEIVLNRLSRSVTSAVAEVSPNDMLSTDRAVPMTCDVLPVIGADDAGVRQVAITLPAGFANPTVTSLELGEALQEPISPASPTGYDVSLAGQTLTITLGSTLTTSDVRVRVSFNVDAPPGGGPFTFGVVLGNGALATPAVAGDADGDPTDANALRVDVTFTRGLVVELTKLAPFDHASIGDVVTYVVEIRNTTDTPVAGLVVDDELPTGFDYLGGSARVDGVRRTEPTGGRVRRFDVGTLAGFPDADGDGIADPGEPGYMRLTYSLVVGTGARPGDHDNRALARDGCEACIVSNLSTARVRVERDALLDLCTIVGKVFVDADGDGVQDDGEPGVPEARVVLDDGTYVVTDPYGRYHFPRLEPGDRMVKLDLASLPGAEADEVHRVVWLTPGITQKASFGVRLVREVHAIGAPARPGATVEPIVRYEPVVVRGNANTLTLMINDGLIALASCNVELAESPDDQVVELVGSRLSHPVTFRLAGAGRAPLDRWMLAIYDADGARVRTIEGKGALPSDVTWDGITDAGTMLVAGAVYEYQLEVMGTDGSRALAPRRRFGVNRTAIVSLNLTGDAFDTASDELSDEARRALTQVAEVLREHRDETVVIEGHTDAVGSHDYNLALSRRRAETAAAFLRQRVDLSDDQIVLGWFGEERPVAPNDRPEGRALNRRVVVRGEAKEVTIASIRDQYRTRPAVEIDGRSVLIGPDGRFSLALDDRRLDALSVTMNDPGGGGTSHTVEIPSAEILEPTSSFVLAIDRREGMDVDASREGWTARSGGPGGVRVSGRLRGRTDPANSVEVDGVPVVVDSTGGFAAPLELGRGSNVVGVLVRNGGGATRIVNVDLRVATEAPGGEPIIVADAIPSLSLDLPLAGTVLGSTKLPISGHTDPGSRVVVNDRELSVDPLGRVQGTIEVPEGRSHLVAVVTDAEGRTASIAHDVEVGNGEGLFLLAFADARLGASLAHGNLETAGRSQHSQGTAEGRIALYLKGRISGKTLVTAALDTRDRSFHELFENLGDEELNRLATNLDPDRMYPVYGDASTVVYDAESQGKLYVAIEAEEMRALVGNYAVRFSDTELGAYARTLYGGRFHYVSSARTADGSPKTEIFLFGSESRHTHVRDLLRGTGGSLYYLSNGDVVEGSEQIALVVRDIHTGLVLSRRPLSRNADYAMKHLEGRVLMHRPVPSVVTGESLVDFESIEGNPVFIEVDYEVSTAVETDLTGGARVHRQISDRLALGGTYVDDAPRGDAYELVATDAELRLFGGSRFVGEVASTRGTDASSYVSADGGLTYAPAPAEADADGNAWKAALEVDVGELVSRPGAYWVRAYVKRLDKGFLSAGNRIERGTQKLGISTSLDLSAHDDVRARVDVEDRLGASLDGEADETVNAAARWDHRRARWGSRVELRANRVDDPSGHAIVEHGVVTAGVWSDVRDGVRVDLERQQTLSGDRRDQTALGVSWHPTDLLGVDVRGADGTIGRSLDAGAELALGDRRVYVSERLTDGASPGRTSVLGVESAFGAGGRVYSEYQWGRSSGHDRAMSLAGVEQRWRVAAGLTVGVAAEAARTEAGDEVLDRHALSGLAAYEQPRLTLTTRNEVRLEDGAIDRVQVVTASRADVRLVPDLSLRGHLRYSRTRDRETDRVEARLEERGVGVAYRPVGTDGLQALARYTRIRDLRPVEEHASLRRERTLDVVSAEAIADVMPRLQWTGKAAARHLENRIEALDTQTTLTYLGILRCNARVWRHLAIGTEYRVLTQREADDHRAGWLSEVTWDLARHLYVGGGYNFTDFSDDEFRMDDYSVTGWFVRLQGRY